MSRRSRLSLSTCWRWWCLKGQFSLPVRVLSPKRRRIHHEVSARVSQPGYHQAATLRVGLGLALARAASTPGHEEKLLARIFSSESSPSAQPRNEGDHR